MPKAIVADNTWPNPSTIQTLTVGSGISPAQSCYCRSRGL